MGMVGWMCIHISLSVCVCVCVNGSMARAGACPYVPSVDQLSGNRFVFHVCVSHGEPLIISNGSFGIHYFRRDSGFSERGHRTQDPMGNQP